MPTTSQRGVSSRTSRSIAPHSGPLASIAAAGRGAARPVSVSPAAIPMRLRPKSNARTACAGREGSIRACGTCSGIARDDADLADLVAVESDELPRALPALLERHAEHDALVRRHRQPGVLANLALELARIPPRVPEGDEGVRRPLAARHRLEHVARGGDLDAAGDLDRAVPLASRTVQDEPAVGAYGAAAQHRLRGDLLVAGMELH